MKPKYEFEPLGNSPEDGYNDPLKTIFGQDPESVAKEAFQNSIDAAADATKPVRVKVGTFKDQLEEIFDIRSSRKH